MNAVSFIEAKLQVVVFKDEDGAFIAYAPALNLSAYGDSKNDALDSFQETFDMVIQDLYESGEIINELYELGWTVQKSPKPSFKPPYFRSKKELMDKLEDIASNIDPTIIKTSSQGVRMPVM